MSQGGDEAQKQENKQTFHSSGCGAIRNPMRQVSSIFIFESVLTFFFFSGVERGGGIVVFHLKVAR